MTSRITASNVNNVQIFDATNSGELHLCEQHRGKLGTRITENLNTLVATNLFQTHFREFLPTGNTPVDVNIFVTTTAITVTKLSDRQTKTLALSGLSDLDVTQVSGINTDILQKANNVYRKCWAENQPPHQGNGAASAVVSPTHSERPAGNGAVSEPVRHQDPASSVPPSSASVCATQARLLREEIAEAHSTALVPQTATAAQAPDNRTTQKLTRIEAELAALEQRLGLEPQSRLPTGLNAKLASVESRIKAIDRRIQGEIASRSATPPPEAQESNYVPRMEPLAPELPRETFDTLMNMASELASPTHKDGTTLPEAMATQFSQLPKITQHALFHQTFDLAPREVYDIPWIGEKLFLGKQADTPWPNLNRAQAMRSYLSLTLVNGYWTPLGKRSDDDELQRRLRQLLSTSNLH